MPGVLFVGDINVDIIMGGLASLPVVDREISYERFEITMGSSAVFAACTYACLGKRTSFLGSSRSWPACSRGPRRGDCPLPWTPGGTGARGGREWSNGFSC